MDQSREQMLQEVKPFFSNIMTVLRVLEEGTAWSNRSELFINIMKEEVCRVMKKDDSPLVLCDYCMERRARVRTLTARNIFHLHSSNPRASLTNEEGFISNLYQHS